eukprot:CAMPEP_0176446444 /NCGR_PEP_ID=MMETSP0127-20121128/24333_1 /TAXON_ID=938130 /ORGANISM="Platyophrya macrostoma, Strain WH" /LENGTH=236 /DNA_ID=CAMNT_0017832487 /DNA_START=37 /DNA_END=750 /DNA_ORIENTATION=-
MKALTVMKYLLWILDVVGMAGLCYAGIDTFLHFHLSPADSSADSSITYEKDANGTITGATANTNVNNTRSVQDVVWAIYYILFSFIITLSIPRIPPIRRWFKFLTEHMGRGIFIAFWGTLLLSKAINLILGIGIYLIILGAIHIVYGICLWKHGVKREDDGTADPAKKYETGMAQPEANNQRQESKKDKKKDKKKIEDPKPLDDAETAYGQNKGYSPGKKNKQSKFGLELDDEGEP